ncbi:hypothetical protein KAI87_10015 [Myxococcota bacterium]|nr:hypothetical protein [Myxococcota bacterium]
MKKALSSAFSFLLVLSFSAPLWAGNGPWEVVKDELGIKVFHRSVDGADYKEFKGEATVSASIPALVALIKDVKACSKWQHKCGKMTVLSPDYSFQLTDLPWPLTDRYAVFHTRFLPAADGQSFTIEVENIKPSKLPSNLRSKVPTYIDLVHMKKADGFWKFTKVNAAITKVVYQMRLDPGSLPSAMVNAGLVDKPFLSLKGMKKIVREPKYKNQK